MYAILPSVPRERVDLSQIVFTLFRNNVLEMGLEPISLAACDFESHVYTIPPLQHIISEYESG